MNPLLLQKQLKDNASDLNDFYADLKTWGEDMKKKELHQNSSTTSTKNTKVSGERKPPSKPDIKRLKTSPKTKTKFTDYSAWDKFDADAECEKIDQDENAESDLTDECDETARDESYLEKEKGNKFVKEQKWDEAIKCYTKAIDFFSYDPVFYANRALCFLKKENYEKAESDCTMSLKLDGGYVKAYQRRAAAREALGKLEDAEADLLKVLNLEPKNKESTHNLELLRKKLGDRGAKPPQRNISKFSASRTKKIPPTNKEMNLKQDFWPDGPTDLIPVKTVTKPAHLKSKKPLKRIEIRESDEISAPETVSFPNVGNLTSSLNTDDLKVIERHSRPSVPEIIKENKNHANNIRMQESQKQLSAPKNSVQFYSQWRHLKTVDDRYGYVKLIRPEDLPVIFKESLDSNVFSEIVEVMVKCFVQNNDDVFGFLKAFPGMKRFSTIILFMTEVDKNNLRQLFEYVRQHTTQNEGAIDFLFKVYEL